MRMPRTLVCLALALLMSGRAVAQNTSPINTELPPAVAATDSDPNTAAPAVKGELMAWDGATFWKRVTFGQQTMANSLPVVISSNQSGITVVQSVGTNFHMVCDSGCSSSTAPADNSAFTAGTTSQSPMGGFYHAARDTVTDGRMAAVAITSKRALYNSLETPLGVSAMNETAGAVKNLMVDGTGAPIPLSDGGSGAASANTTRAIAATDSPEVTALGAPGDTAATVGSTGSVSAKARLMTTQLDAIQTAVQTNPGYLGASATTTNQPVECAIVSAASTNSTSCKGSAGNWYGIDIYNTTTTVYYLRLYNTAAAPTCSSATGFIRSIPIPPAPAAGQVGGIVRVLPIAVGYATGIGYCLTAGSSSTDNTNAATGIFGALLYK